MTSTPINHEFSIPISIGSVIWHWFFTALVCFFTLLSLRNLFLSVAIIASGIWLICVIWGFLSSLRKSGGIRLWLINRLGDLGCRAFILYSSDRTPRRTLTFGIKFLGRRFTRLTMEVAQIKSIAWHAGQGTALAGRDMNDWQVFLDFMCRDKTNILPDLPDDQARRKHLSIGPSGSKKRIEAFGLLFVEFVRQAGAPMVPSSHEPTRFVSDKSLQPYSRTSGSI